MESHDVSFEFKARYYTLGQITPATRSIWFVLHGYAQLAAYFVKKFETLNERNIYVVAPEALSRFYVDPLQSTGRASDRVGATWMTKENRLVDIENYLTYLNTLYAHLSLPKSIPVTILGFSQGAATVCRWIGERKIKFDRMILWSGIFPPDMNIVSAKESLRGKEVLIVYGTEDPFLNESQYQSMQDISSKLDVLPRIVTFKGGHEINEAILTQLI